MKIGVVPPCTVIRGMHSFDESTDIEKAFLHILLHEGDRDWTRYLWLTGTLDPESEFLSYRFNIWCCVHLLCRMPLTLHCHLSWYRSSIAQDMLTTLYVDNVVTGCESEKDAIQYYNTACSIVKEAQFNLRSWVFPTTISSPV